MRFSSTFLASAVSALAYAAPVAEQRDDECVYEPEPTSSVVATSAVSVSSVAAVASTSSSSAAFSSVASVASSSVASVAFTSAVSSVASTSAAPSVTAATSTTAAVSTTVSSSAAASGSSSGSLQWFGANESGAEFGTGSIPGTLGTDYTWPNTSAIDILMSNGMNIFRIPILMERIVPTEITGTVDATYLSGLQTVVTHITDAGGHAVIDPHNYGRYSGNIITSTSDFQTFWTTLATEFKDNDNVVFDCNNEFHDMPSNALVANLNQACIDGVRAAGATTQYIFVEGTAYTGAWTWVSSGNADSMGNLTDTENKIVYEFHQYLDSDGSGTSATCVSTTIGAERVAVATNWLKENGKVGILGEFAGGANSDCETAVTGMLDALTESSDVWMGAMWWGAGPWWADYIYSMEPSTGTCYTAYESILSKYT